MSDRGQHPASIVRRVPIMLEPAHQGLRMKLSKDSSVSPEVSKVSPEVKKVSPEAPVLTVRVCHSTSPRAYARSPASGAPRLGPSFRRSAHAASGWSSARGPRSEGLPCRQRQGGEQAQQGAEMCWCGALTGARRVLLPVPTRDKQEPRAGCRGYLSWARAVAGMGLSCTQEVYCSTVVSVTRSRTSLALPVTPSLTHWPSCTHALTHSSRATANTGWEVSLRTPRKHTSGTPAPHSPSTAPPPAPAPSAGASHR